MITGVPSTYWVPIKYQFLPLFLPAQDFISRTPSVLCAYARLLDLYSVHLLKLLSSLPPLVRPWFTFWPFPLRFRSPVSLRALCVCLFRTIPFPLLHGSWGQSQGAAGSALWSCQGSLDKAPFRWAWHITHSECVGQVPAISTAPWLLLPPQREYTRGSREERLRRLSRLAVLDYLRICGLSPHRMQTD